MTERLAPQQEDPFGRVVQHLPVPFLLYLSRVGIPGNERALGELSRRITAANGVEQFTAGRKGRFSEKAANGLKLHLLSHGLLTASLAVHEGKKPPEAAIEAIRLALAGPRNPESFDQVHYPFLQMTRELQADQYYGSSNRWKSLRLWAGFVPFIERQAAVLVLEDVLQFQQGFVEVEKAGPEVALHYLLMRDFPQNLEWTLKDRGVCKDPMVWSEIFLTAAERLPNASRQFLRKDPETDEEEQITLPSLRSLLLGAFWEAAGQMEYQTQLAFSEATIVASRRRNPDLLDQDILLFAQLCPQSRAAQEYLGLFIQSGDEELQRAAVKSVFSPMMRRSIEKHPRSKKEETITALNQFIKQLIESPHESVRLDIWEELLGWLGVDREMVGGLFETGLQSIVEEQCSNQERQAIYDSLDEIASDLARGLEEEDLSDSEDFVHFFRHLWPLLDRAPGKQSLPDNLGRVALWFKARGGRGRRRAGSPKFPFREQNS